MKTKKTKKLSHTNQFARNIQLFKLFLCCLSCLTFLSHLREIKNRKLSHYFRSGPENRHFLVHFSNKKTQNCPRVSSQSLVFHFKEREMHFAIHALLSELWQVAEVVGT